jgi:site-specific recombinase XerD
MPWNKGMLVGQKKPLQPRQVWIIRVRLELTSTPRELAMFNLAIDSKLRACNLVKLRIEDVCSGQSNKDRATVVQQKTGHTVRFEITEGTRQSIQAILPYLRAQGSQFLFPSRSKAKGHITTRQYSRIVSNWIESIGLEPSAYGTHTMRRTKAAQIYKRIGNLRAVQLLLGHVKLESTVRYLGVEVDDALALSEQLICRDIKSVFSPAL